MDRFLPTAGWNSSAGKRSAATLRASGRGRARRESEEQIPRQPQAGLCRDDRQEEPQRTIDSIQIYSIHVSSKFHANSLKTNDRCPFKPQQKAGPVRPARHDPMTGLPRPRRVALGRSIVIPPALTQEGSEHRESRGGAPNYSTHVPSNFRANSLKTNDGRTCKVTHKTCESISAGCRAEDRAATIKSSSQELRHACFVGPGGTCPEQGRGNAAISEAVASLPLALIDPREFPASLATRHLPLATNHSHETARLPRPLSRDDCKPRRHPCPSLLSSAEALRIIFRCMIVVLYKRNFFEPGEPRWALLFSGPKTSHTSQSSNAFRREND